jgi:hypothetical protein
MWVAWGLFGFLQMASNRYLKPFWRVRMWLHRIFGTIILILTIAMSILGIKQNNWTQSGKSGHSTIGLIVFFATFLVAVGGVAARSVTRRKVWRTRFIHKCQGIHKVRPCLVLTYYAAWGESRAYIGAGIYSAGIFAAKLEVWP